MNWSAFSDTLLIEVLKSRGYIVRHKGEARRPLSWNRTSPFPEGLDFKSEAVDKIRQQIDADMIEFETRAAGYPAQEIHSATLRLI